ncbi:MAG: hypothetical protein LLF94_00580 [Chlamydiales bacterium]|nr:hypothetical protein [Chlamydiales bacterium]
MEVIVKSVCCGKLRAVKNYRTPERAYAHKLRRLRVVSFFALAKKETQIYLTVNLGEELANN